MRSCGQVSIARTISPSFVGGDSRAPLRAYACVPVEKIDQLMVIHSCGQPRSCSWERQRTPLSTALSTVGGC